MKFPNENSLFLAIITEQGIDTEDVQRVTPFIEDDEQSYKVAYRNNWLECGHEETTVTLTEVLLYIANQQASKPEDRIAR